MISCDCIRRLIARARFFLFRLFCFRPEWIFRLEVLIGAWAFWLVVIWWLVLFSPHKLSNSWEIYAFLTSLWLEGPRMFCTNVGESLLLVFGAELVFAPVVKIKIILIQVKWNTRGWTIWKIAYTRMRFQRFHTFLLRFQKFLCNLAIF